MKVAGFWKSSPHMCLYLEGLLTFHIRIFEYAWKIARWSLVSNTKNPSNSTCSGAAKPIFLLNSSLKTALKLNIGESLTSPRILIMEV